MAFQGICSRVLGNSVARLPVRGRRILSGTFIASLVLAGCQGLFSVSSVPNGQLIDPPERPDAAACEALLEGDVDTQVQVRAGFGVEGVPATEAAVAAAAGGDLAFGVPLTLAEIERLRAAGSTEPDQAALLAGLAHAHRDTFAGVRIDNGTIAVQVLRFDVAQLMTARCLEVGDSIGRVRYETAGVSTAELDELLTRVVADMDLLRDAGVDPTTVWTDATNGTVVVGLAPMTPEAVALLTERYGYRIRVVEHGGFHQAP